MKTFLNLLADLVANEIRKDILNGLNTESGDQTRLPITRGKIHPNTNNTGESGPIPKFLNHSQQYSQEFPRDPFILPSKQKKRGDL